MEVGDTPHQTDALRCVFLTHIVNNYALMPLPRTTLHLGTHGRRQT